MTLAPVYDAAKYAANQASVDAIKAVVDAIKAIDDKLDTTMEVDGAVHRFTANALEQTPTDGGSVTIDNDAIADAILKRDWTLISGEAIYSLLNAARLLRCNWQVNASTLTVRKENGSTVAWTKALTTDATAEPIIGVS
jgi:hypothetical protein